MERDKAKRKRKKGSALILTGLLLMAAALALTGYNLWDGLRAGQAAGETTARLEELMPEPASRAESVLPGETEIPDYQLNPEMEMPTVTVGGGEYIGLLSIPALELELPVLGEWSYDGLKTAPCRYAGSAYSGGLIIAGHNYAAHFGGLSQLREGDMLRFTDMDGNEFVYETAALEVLSGSDREGMESGGWDLTLFTCTADGQNRVTVRAVRSE